MKKKIIIKATIGKKNNLIKINQKAQSDILILKKEFALPSKKIIRNKLAQDFKNDPFILKKNLVLKKIKKSTKTIFSI